ncbi:hypothetical protein BJV74DRAFT_988416 [Russula compacta]|nr:hypothetical protein BJV74DRAFT_988416 [Russula compacta]
MHWRFTVSVFIAGIPLKPLGHGHNCTGIASNSDIAGIGVRINFYLTILLTALTPEVERNTELLDGLYTNSVINGLGLVITAVIQTVQDQLDLYHAIFVMQIIFSLNFVYSYGQRRFLRSSKRIFRMKIFIGVQTLSTVVFTVWLMYVWIKDSSFGSQPECNHLVKYVLVFADVRATVNWLRVLFIMNLVWGDSFVYMEDLHTNIHDKLRSVVPGRQERRNQETAGVGERNAPRAETTVRAYVNASVVWAVYGVATLELIVQRNRPHITSGEDDWGFGQIIALILILGSVIDIVVTIPSEGSLVRGLCEVRQNPDLPAATYVLRADTTAYHTPFIVVTALPPKYYL